MFERTRNFAPYSTPASAALALAAPAPAAVVTITSGPNAGTVVFDAGGYETPPYVVGDTPVASDATIGTWVLGPQASVGIEVVTGASTTNLNGDAVAGPTAAYDGDNYLTGDRSSGANANNYIVGSFTQDIDLATTSFEVEFAFWGLDGSYNFFAVGSDDMARISTTPDESIADIAFDARFDPPGPELNPLGVNVPNVGSFNLGEWNEATFAWNHVDQESTLTVNGNEYVMTAPDGSTTTVVGEFNFGTGGQGPLYVDAVPEPGSFALAAGGMGLLAMRRRQR